jgi:hypothetical protein
LLRARAQNEYYTAMIGAKPLGINGASLLWMVRIEIVLKPLSQLKGRG